jgi:hypothetical protein
VVLVALASPVYASDIDDARAAGEEFAGGDVIMVDGPFYVDGTPYYVVDYMLLSEVQASLVYDPIDRKFVTASDTMQKVFATKDLKNLIVWDPLFYAIGDDSKIPMGAAFDTQNVRNFAEFSSINEEEDVLLEDFLSTYESMFDDVSVCSSQTNAILYPEDAYSFKYSRTEPNIMVEVYKSSESGFYSYEGFQELVECYDAVYADYLQMTLDLNAFAGGLEEYPPGTTIREKWEVVLTKEGIMQEIALVGDNAGVLSEKISLRKDILSYPYDNQINTARERMGLPTTGGIKSVCGPTFILLISMGGLFLTRYRKRLLGPSLFILMPLLFMGLASSVSHEFSVPGYSELISNKVTNASEVDIEMATTGISEETARELIEGFPLLLEGEDIKVVGPYYYYGNPAYIMEIVKEGEQTGYIILIDGTTFRLVANQQAAFQIQKARFLRDMIDANSLYIDADVSLIEAEAQKTDIPPLEIFLTNLSVNIKEGQELEQKHLTKPDFETARDLAQHYIKASVLLKNIERIVSLEEANAITGGFSEDVLLLEAYGRAMQGLSADEFFEARRSRYRGRTLNRLPLMQTLVVKGLVPSKAQVVHDLTSDLVYDNSYIWHLGTVDDPNLFARLAFKEGTYTTPGSLGVNYTLGDNAS